MTRLLCLLILIVLWHSSVQAASKYEESLKELAEGVAAEAIKMKKGRLAVMDFVDSKGEVTPIGRFLSEELATHLLVAGELKVVDHKLLAATMKKHQLTHLEASQAKAAKLIGPYTVYPVGAARAVVPKAGPLAALLKQPDASPPAATIAAPEPTVPVLDSHENDQYKVSVLGITRRDDRIALDLLFENRSPQPVKIGCQLLDTYLQNEQGEQWKQDVAQSREGLCTRGLELNPMKQQRANLSFPVNDRPTPGTVSLHYHETSPRPDRLVILDGLKLDAAPAAGAEPPATQEPVTSTP